MARRPGQFHAPSLIPIDRSTDHGESGQRRRRPAELHEDRAAHARHCAGARAISPGARPHRAALRRGCRRVFFDELELAGARPSLSASARARTRSRPPSVMMRVRAGLPANSRDVVVVVGDVNSTLACALVAAKLGVAGRARRGRPAQLRPHDARRDQPHPHRRARPLAVRHRTPTAIENLRREGVPAERIHFVGNVMIDTLLTSSNGWAASPAGSSPRRWCGARQVWRLHPAPAVQRRLPGSARADCHHLRPGFAHPAVLFPVHPRTRERLHPFGIDSLTATCSTAPCGTSTSST